MHLVFECAAMADLRGQFPDVFQAHQMMLQCMWQPTLLQSARLLDGRHDKTASGWTQRGVGHLISQAGNGMMQSSCLVSTVTMFFHFGPSSNPPVQHSPCRTCNELRLMPFQ